MKNVLNMAKLIIFVLLSVVGLCVAKNLPTHINLCSAKDPNINNCIKNEANILIPKMAHGDPKFHIPALDPFLLDKIDAKIGKLNLLMKDIKIFGLDKAQVESVKVDFNNNRLKIQVSIPEVVLKSIYTMNGNILVLPVEGTGPMEIKMKGATFDADCTIENARQDSKEPLKFVDSALEYHYNDIYFHFDNLFNGNKELGDPVNKLLNDEHSLIDKDFHPIFIKLINTVVKSIINQIVDGYHFNDVFKE